MLKSSQAKPIYIFQGIKAGTKTRTKREKMNLGGEGIEEADSTTDDQEEDEVGRVGGHGLYITIIHPQVGQVSKCSLGTSGSLLHGMTCSGKRRT